LQQFKKENFMTHTVDLDDHYVDVRKPRHYKSVRESVAPEGYMTSEEFKKRAVAKVNAFCDKYGIL